MVNQTSIASDEPIRSSFSISRFGREAIRRASQWYGVTQGEIVGLAAALYALAAEKSLHDRRRNLAVIKTQVEQACRSLEAIETLAPHLRAAVISANDTVWGIYHIENDSIEQKQVHGVSPEAAKPFSVEMAYAIEFSEKEDDPVLHALQDMAEEVNSEAIKEFRFDGDESESGEIRFQCCEGEREKDIRNDFRLLPSLADDVIASVKTIDEAKNIYRDFLKEVAKELSKQGIDQGDTGEDAS